MKDKRAQADKQPLVPRYLTVEQAAEYLGFATSTIYLWKSQRKIPFIEYPGKKGKHHNGGTLRFDRLALDRFIREHTVRSLPLWDSQKKS